MAAQRFDNPYHSLRVLTTIALKLPAHLSAFIFRHIAEVDAQKFQTRLHAFLNFKSVIGAPCQVSATVRWIVCRAVNSTWSGMSFRLTTPAWSRRQHFLPP